MNGNLRWYYVTRGLMVLAWVGLMALLGTPREIMLVGAVLMAAFYLWLPRSGRYVIRTDRPLSPLLRDEREHAISSRAATYAFVAMLVPLAAAVLVASLRGQDAVSTDLISSIIAVSMTVWFVASFWLRRKT
ncbi:MAG TPA: hypothetical protein VMY98_05335 [Anaerolineae bacterium]|nr:hypothetical protein [Anaerolineae bacterium]